MPLIVFACSPLSFSLWELLFTFVNLDIRNSSFVHLASQSSFTTFSSSSSPSSVLSLSLSLHTRYCSAVQYCSQLVVYLSLYHLSASVFVCLNIFVLYPNLFPNTPSKLVHCLSKVESLKKSPLNYSFLSIRFNITERVKKLKVQCGL